MDKMIDIANLEVPNIQNAFEGLIDPSHSVKATNLQSLSVARLSEDIIKPIKLLRPYGNVTSLDESGQHWLSISIGYCNGCCGCPTTWFGAHSKTP